MRKAVAIVALVFAGSALAAAEPLTVLPRPPFRTAGKAPAGSRVSLAIASSQPRNPAVSPAVGVRPRSTAPFRGVPPLLVANGLVLYGRDGNTARYVVSPGRYAFDFAKYAWPPRIRPGEREFVYEQVMWAKEAGDVLYVQTGHLTYARSSYGQNAYLNAIDLKTNRLLWRSPALVANARNFVLAGDVIVSGYGFTAEPDYLYALDRATGHVLARLLLPSAPEQIARHGSTLTVRTYDHLVVVKLR